MISRWEESEFVFCDLQGAARYIQRNNPESARRFLEAAYDTFEFLAQNPGAGRSRVDLGFAEVRSWRVEGFQKYLVFYREIPEGVQIWRVLHGSRDLEKTLSLQ